MTGCLSLPSLQGAFVPVALLPKSSWHRPVARHCPHLGGTVAEVKLVATGRPTSPPLRGAPRPVALCCPASSRRLRPTQKPTPPTPPFLPPCSQAISQGVIVTFADTKIELDFPMKMTMSSTYSRKRNKCPRERPKLIKQPPCLAVSSLVNYSFSRKVSRLDGHHCFISFSGNHANKQLTVSRITT